MSTQQPKPNKDDFLKELMLEAQSDHDDKFRSYDDFVNFIEKDNNRKKDNFARVFIGDMSQELLAQKQRRERLSNQKKNMYIDYIIKNQKHVHDDFDKQDLYDYSLFDVIEIYNTIKETKKSNNKLRKLIKFLFNLK